MKIQFDSEQAYQKDAVAAITDLFDGQPKGAPDYSVIDLGKWGDSGLFAGQARTELGIGNQLILAPEKLLTNVRVIQERNDIESDNPKAPLECWELFARWPRLCRRSSVLYPHK